MTYGNNGFLLILKEYFAHVLKQNTIYKALKISSNRKIPQIWAMLEKKIFRVRFVSRSCLEETTHELERNLYISVFIYFSSIDKSLIVNC